MRTRRKIGCSWFCCFAPHAVDPRAARGALLLPCADPAAAPGDAQPPTFTQRIPPLRFDGRTSLPRTHARNAFRCSIPSTPCAGDA